MRLISPLLAVATSAVLLNDPAFGGSIAIDSFDSGPFTRTTSGTETDTNLAAPTALGGLREMVTLNATNSTNDSVSGAWTISGQRGDVRYGDGNSTSLPALNLDGTGMTQFEFEVVSLSGGAPQVYLQLFTRVGSLDETFWYWDLTDLAINTSSPGTIVVPFNQSTIGPDGGPQAADLADIDGIDFRIDMQGAAGNIEITEFGFTDGSTVPEPGSALLAVLGFAGLALRRLR